MRISDGSSDVCSSDLQALSQRGKRTGARAPCKREEAHERDRAGTEKSERISLERLAVGDEPADKLDEPEAKIEQDDEPERTTIGRVLLGPPRIAAATAALLNAFFHESALQPPVTGGSSGFCE